MPIVICDEGDALSHLESKSVKKSLLKKSLRDLFGNKGRVMHHTFRGA